MTEEVYRITVWNGNHRPISISYKWSVTYQYTCDDVYLVYSDITSWLIQISNKDKLGNDKMKNTKYHTVGTIHKSIRHITETEVEFISLKHICYSTHRNQVGSRILLVQIGISISTSKYWNSDLCLFKSSSNQNSNIY